MFVTPSPGRFYASAALKMMVANTLVKYEMKFVDKTASRTFSWRSAIVPRSSNSLMVRERIR